MSKENFTLQEAIRRCYKASKKTNISKKCADKHLQLAEWLKELQNLRQEKAGTTEKADTTDSGFVVIQPNYQFSCENCCYRDSGCINGNIPLSRREAKAPTCLAFEDRRYSRGVKLWFEKDNFPYG